MNNDLKSSSGICYVQQQTYVQERDGMTYKLDKETQQWIPSDSLYTSFLFLFFFLFIQRILFNSFRLV